MIPTLSKSQKKRNKRKVQKEKQNAPSTYTPSIPKDSLNPLDIIRSNLVERGYDLVEVDKAMEEMWNLQLVYDEFDSVLSYLESKKENDILLGYKTNEVEKYQSDTVVEKNVDDEVLEKETPAVVSTVSSSSLSPERNGINSNAPTSVAQENVVAVSDNMSSMNNNPVEASDDTFPTNHTMKEEESSNRRDSDDSTQMKSEQLLSTLDTVAKAENLVDAINALDEWIEKVATVEDVQKLYSVPNNSALYIIIQRSITSNDLIHETTPSLLRLIASILRVGNFPPNDVSSFCSTTASILQSAQKAIYTCPENRELREKMSTETAKLIVSITSQTLQLLALAPTSNEEDIFRLKNDIEKMSSVILPTGSGVLPLMKKRDCYKATAEKSSELVSSSIQVFGREKESLEKIKKCHPENIHIRVAPIDQTLSMMLGNEFYDSSLNNNSLDDTSKGTGLLATINSYMTQRNKIATRMEELKEELHKLQLEDEALKRKIDNSQGKLSNVKVQEAAMEVAKSIDGFSTSCTKTVVSCLKPDSAITSEKLKSITNYMESFIIRMKNYFQAESNMIGFLQTRVDSDRSSLPQLEKELNAFQSLKMTKNVASLEHKLNELRSNIAEDTGVIDCLNLEAKNMRKLLIERLDEYKGICHEVGRTAFMISTLKAIRDCVDGMGLTPDHYGNSVIDFFINDSAN